MEREIRTESLEKIKAEINPDEEILDLREHIKILNARLKDYKKEHGSLKTFFRDLRYALNYELGSLDPESSQYRPPEKKAIRHPIISVAQSTDGHLGMVQQADEIEEFNKFNPQICKARQMYFSHSLIKYTELHRSVYVIDELAHIVTGDMISGDIHKELSITNAFPTPIQTAEAGCLLADQIAYEAPHFKKITVHFICEDNHSRLSEHIQSKEAGMNTLNYLVGFIAKERLKQHTNVEFNIYPMLQKVIKIGNRRYLITHGHKVRGWAGFPWYGIERKVGREAIKRMMGRKHGFDKVIMGHWHCPLTHPWFWIGGSVSGTDAYDHGEGRYAEPSQPAWLVHPSHGEFNRTDFILTEADSEVK